MSCPKHFIHITNKTFNKNTMKTSNLNSILLRACCVFFMAFAMVVVSQSSAIGQTKAELRVEFQKVLNDLPDARTTKKLNPASQQLINNTRSLYQQGLGIESMSPSQETTFYNNLNANHQTLVAAAANKSCVQTCTDERETCIVNRCGNNTSFPCWCCIPCNAIWELCLFDCLVDIEIGISIAPKAVK